MLAAVVSEAGEQLGGAQDCEDLAMYLPTSMFLISSTISPGCKYLTNFPIVMQVSFLALGRVGTGKSLCMLVQSYATMAVRLYAIIEIYL